MHVDVCMVLLDEWLGRNYVNNKKIITKKLSYVTQVKSISLFISPYSSSIYFKREQNKGRGEGKE